MSRERVSRVSRESVERESIEGIERERVSACECVSVCVGATSLEERRKLFFVGKRQW